MEKSMKLHNCISAVLIVFWLADLVLTTVGIIRGYSTMTSVDLKLAYLNSMVDFLWIFGLTFESVLCKNISKTYEWLLHIVDYLTKDVENRREFLKAVEDIALSV